MPTIDKYNTYNYDLLIIILTGVFFLEKHAVPAAHFPDSLLASFGLCCFQFPWLFCRGGQNQRTKFCHFLLSLPGVLCSQGWSVLRLVSSYKYMVYLKLQFQSIVMYNYNFIVNPLN